jgi:PBP1b-binding outer membrane lipoprotein LpoB
MNLRKLIAVCALLLLAMGLMLGGCQKKEEAAKEEQPAAQEQPAMTADTTMTADSTMAH